MKKETNSSIDITSLNLDKNDNSNINIINHNNIARENKNIIINIDYKEYFTYKIYLKFIVHIKR